ADPLGPGVREGRVRPRLPGPRARAHRRRSVARRRRRSARPLRVRAARRRRHRPPRALSPGQAGVARRGGDLGATGQREVDWAPLQQTSSTTNLSGSRNMNGTLAGRLSVTIAALALSSGLAMAQGSGAKPADPKAQAAQRAPVAEKLDINTASVGQLEALKGVGPVRAAAIVKGRPYKGKDDLVRRKILPQSVYDEISDQIIAKQK